MLLTESKKCSPVRPFHAHLALPGFAGGHESSSCIVFASLDDGEDQVGRYECGSAQLHMCMHVLFSFAKIYSS